MQQIHKFVYLMFMCRSTCLSVLWVAYATPQTCSNSSTIEADSSNGVTNTRCYRYSCMRS
jgi:hypothetical protein